MSAAISCNHALPGFSQVDGTNRRLYHVNGKETLSSDAVIQELVVPKELGEQVLWQLHGTRWICSKGVQEYCCKCDVCTEIRGPLQHLVGSPMKHIALDNLGPLTVTKQGNQYLLFIANYFSKWTEAVPMPNQEASTVADLLVKEVICQCQCQCQCFIPVDKDLHIKTSWI